MKRNEMRRLAAEFERLSGLAFVDEQLLFNALCHSSYAHEHNVKSNERLEFLGDSVLGIVISERLFADEKQAPEGKLSQMRARVVSEEPLAAVAKEKGFDELLLLGVGEMRAKPSKSMIADEMEAIIGAIYLDQGLEKAREFVLDNFSSLILAAETAPQTNDCKSLLQEKYYQDGVRYVTTEKGAEHEPTFLSVVYVGNKVAGRGKGRNKRAAEKAAAEAALLKLEKKN